MSNTTILKIREDYYSWLEFPVDEALRTDATEAMMHALMTFREAGHDEATQAYLEEIMEKVCARIWDKYGRPNRYFTEHTILRHILNHRVIGDLGKKVLCALHLRLLDNPNQERHYHEVHNGVCWFHVQCKESLDTITVYAPTLADDWWRWTPYNTRLARPEPVLVDYGASRLTSFLMDQWRTHGLSFGDHLEHTLETDDDDVPATPQASPR